MSKNPNSDNFIRAQEIVNNWPEWKRTISLTKQSKNSKQSIPVPELSNKKGYLPVAHAKLGSSC